MISISYEKIPLTFQFKNSTKQSITFKEATDDVTLLYKLSKID